MSLTFPWRLLTSTQNNFELRKDLVDTLSTGTGEDLMRQISGKVLNSVVPRGLMGGASALAVGAEFFHLLNPSVAPLLLAASPRVVGEFLRVYGKGLMQAGKVAPMLTRSVFNPATYSGFKGEEGQQTPSPTQPQAQQSPATTPTASQPTQQPTSQPQGGGLGASIGAALDPAKAAYAEGTIPQQAPVKATGVALRLHQPRFQRNQIARFDALPQSH